MTTIAASLSRRMMAADARVVVDNKTLGTRVGFTYTKLVRTRDWIVGCAGDVEDIQRFIKWLRAGGKGKRPKVKREFEALLMSRKELLHVGDDEDPGPVRDGYMAIGTGAPFALGSLTTQMLLGEDPDPRVAVTAACHHDPNSREPVDFLTWRVD